MRLLVLHQNFLGEQDAGGSRFNELTRFWAERGHAVTVIAGTVSYTTGKVDPKYKGRWLTEEHVRGVRVLRAYAPALYFRGYLGRFVSFLGFMLSAIFAAIIRSGPQDILIASSPPLTVGLSAILIASLKRIPFVFEIRDLWPEFAIETGVIRNRAIIRAAYALEALIYARATAINVLTPAFRDHLVSKKKIPNGKIFHIPNGADLDLMQPGPRDNWVRREYGWGGRFVALYVGAHGRANGLWQIVDAAELVRDRNDLLFALVGDGNEREALASAVRERRLENVQMIPPQPKRTISDFINAADVGLAVLKRVEGFKTVYPNKIFDYMSCARPIVVAIDGEARRLVNEAKAGIYCEAENPTSLRDALLALTADPDGCRRMGQQGYAFVKERFSRASLAEQYEAALLSLTKRTNG